VTFAAPVARPAFVVGRCARPHHSLLVAARPIAGDARDLLTRRDGLVRWPIPIPVVGPDRCVAVHDDLASSLACAASGQSTQVGRDRVAQPFSQSATFPLDEREQSRVYGLVVVHVVRPSAGAQLMSGNSFIYGPSSASVPAQQDGEILGDSVGVVRERLTVATRRPQSDHSVSSVPNLAGLRARCVFSTGAPGHVCRTD
jgi:hypothetical protein